MTTRGGSEHKDERTEADAWEAAWAVISLVMGEATAFLTLYPTLGDVPGFTREGLTVGFGLFLVATYFLAGLPCVHALKHGVNWVKRKIHGSGKASPKES